MIDAKGEKGHTTPSRFYGLKSQRPCSNSYNSTTKINTTTIMTKKHFEAFAKEINKRYDNKVSDFIRHGKDEDTAKGYAAIRRGADYDLVVAVAKQTNSNFDENSFRKACGL